VPGLGLGRTSSVHQGGDDPQLPLITAAGATVAGIVHVRHIVVSRTLQLYFNLSNV